jgi:hypothetical protein
VRLLVSHGLGDLSDENVLKQLMAKHPNRKAPLARSTLEFSAAERLEVDVSKLVEKLERWKSAGPSGLRNEHLFRAGLDEANGERFVLGLSALASNFVNDELPDFVNVVLNAVELAAPIKAPLAAGQLTPKVRPLAMPCPCKRVIEQSMMAIAVEDVQRILEPHQVAVGTPRGPEILVIGFDLQLQHNPSHILIHIDLANMYNEVCLRLAFLELEAHQSLRRLIPAFRAMYKCGRLLLVRNPDGSVQLKEAQESMAQGFAPSIALACLTAHPVILAADAVVAAVGGTVRFFADNGTILRLCACPRLDFWLGCQVPADVIPVAASFDTALLGFVGETMDQDLAAADDVIRGRVRLPARHAGLGIRERATLSHTAFVATTLEVLPKLVDRVGEDGVIIPGFFNVLAPFIGDGCFDHGEEHPFRTFIASGSSRGTAFASSWEKCRGRAGNPEDEDHLLFVDAEDTIIGVDKPQRHLTWEIDDHEFAELKATARNYPQHRFFFARK